MCDNDNKDMVVAEAYDNLSTVIIKVGGGKGKR